MPVHEISSCPHSQHLSVVLQAAVVCSTSCPNAHLGEALHSAVLLAAGFKCLALCESASVVEVLEQKYAAPPLHIFALRDTRGLPLATASSDNNTPHSLHVLSVCTSEDFSGPDVATCNDRICQSVTEKKKKTVINCLLDS